MSCIVNVENLIYDYIPEGKDPVNALNDVSFKIEEGDFVAIIGSNGSGKSTLAKNINGLFIPTGGRVFVDGMDTSLDENIWNIRCTAGMVFQNPDNQIVSTIVEDDVAFGPENMGIDPLKIRKRVDNAISAVDMDDYKRKSTVYLSGGQKQRVAIAGVIAMKPKCIIFDEPTAMLDPKGRKATLEIIKKLNSEGLTIILITHFMDEAALADKIIVMNDGKIIIQGKPEEVFKEKTKIKNAGLEIPIVVELSQNLRERGIEIPEEIVTSRDLARYIARM